jgi:Asp-tRNA(Asn)/Glu-tRNA(Gln) amidotransferase B subunit
MESEKFSVADFEEGLMLAGYISPSSISDLIKKEMLDQYEMNDFDTRLAKATVNWIKGPVMEWLNTNKLEFTTPARPEAWESQTPPPNHMFGSTYNYPGHISEGGYMPVDEEKWMKRNDEIVRILPLPKDEYPYILIYGEPKVNFPIKAEHLRKLICLVEFTDLISFTTASKVVFPEMIKNPDEDPWDIIERLSLIQNNDDSEILEIVKTVISKYPDKVEEYKKGKVGVISLFMGDVMKVGKGKINPKTASELVKKILDEK